MCRYVRTYRHIGFPYYKPTACRFTFYKARLADSLKKGKDAIAIAPEADVTSRIITEAVTSSKPKTRYMAGTVDENKTSAAMFRWIVWLLPDRALDLMIVPKL